MKEEKQATHHKKRKQIIKGGMNERSDKAVHKRPIVCFSGMEQHNVLIYFISNFLATG